MAQVLDLVDLLDLLVSLGRFGDKRCDVFTAINVLFSIGMNADSSSLATV